jgi:cytochrome bd-type quinol oxidase subunit 2
MRIALDVIAVVIGLGLLGYVLRVRMQGQAVLKKHKKGTSQHDVRDILLRTRSLVLCIIFALTSLANLGLHIYIAQNDHLSDGQSIFVGSAQLVLLILSLVFVTGALNSMKEINMKKLERQARIPDSKR